MECDQLADARIIIDHDNLAPGTERACTNGWLGLWGRCLLSQDVAQDIVERVWTVCLGDVRIRSKEQSFNNVLQSRSRGQHRDREKGVRGVTPNCSEDLEAAAVRQIYIEQDCVRALLLQKCVERCHGSNRLPLVAGSF